MAVQGANLALEDAAQLAICLRATYATAAGTGMQVALDDFAARRYPVCEIVRHQSVQMSQKGGAVGGGAVGEKVKVRIPRPQFDPYSSKEVLAEYHDLLRGIRAT